MPKKKRPAAEASKKVPSSSTALLLIGTFVNTTARLFVPTILGVILGLVADNYFGTKPWLTVAGVILGFVIAIYLVYTQIKSIK